jgi:hypothetical protein
MKSVLVLFVVLLCGCAPIYPLQVAPIGHGEYLATQTSLSSWIDARAAAMQRAAKWCEKRGGEFQVVNAEQERIAFPIASNDHSSVVFKCEVPR